MKPRFAWSVPWNEAAALAPLRAWTGVEVCEAADRVWLSAPYLNDDQSDELRRVPGIDRYTVLDDGQLAATGRIVPSGRLPAGPWRPFVDWMRWELPTAALPTDRPASVALRLVRSTEERAPNVLATTLALWGAYAVAAPQVRLARWSFAADRRGRVVVRGTPLPPVRGPRFVEQDGLAVPVGYAWFPLLPADIVRTAFDAPADHLVLWSAENVAQTIAPDDWVQASRSAVRRTLADCAP